MKLTPVLVSLAMALGAVQSAVAMPKFNEKVGTIEVPLRRRASRNLDDQGRVDFSKLSAEIAHLKAKYGRALSNYESNTGKRSKLDGREQQNHKRSIGTVPLNVEAGATLWTGNIAFGSPAQTFPIDFDTGSADTLVNAGVYNPNKSSTAQDTHTIFSTGYEDGSNAHGEVWQDKLTIGGLSADKAYVGLATSDWAHTGNRQGISGLAFPSIATFLQHEPFIYSLINAGVLDEQAFEFKLINGTGSTLTLGSSNKDATWVPLIEETFWGIPASLNGFIFNGVVDSGTTLIVAPFVQALALYNELNLKVQYPATGQVWATFDCDNPPDVRINVGGKNIHLGKDHVAYGQDKNGECYFAVMGEVGLGLIGWILGDPLFAANSDSGVSFDIANKRVGF